jgi:hypothetical protein
MGRGDEADRAACRGGVFSSTPRRSGAASGAQPAGDQARPLDGVRMVLDARRSDEARAAPILFDVEFAEMGGLVFWCETDTSCLPAALFRPDIDWWKAVTT